MEKKTNVVMSPLKDREKMDEELKMLAEGIGRKIAGFKMTKSFANAWYNIRQNDPANSFLIDEIEIETICKHVYDFYNKWNPRRQTEWENMFRDAIWAVKNGIE